MAGGAVLCACGHNKAMHPLQEGCDACSCVWFHQPSGPSPLATSPTAAPVPPPKPRNPLTGPFVQLPAPPAPRIAGPGRISVYAGKRRRRGKLSQVIATMRDQPSGAGRAPTRRQTAGEARGPTNPNATPLNAPCLRCGKLMRTMQPLRFDDGVGGWSHAYCDRNKRRS